MVDTQNDGAWFARRRYGYGSSFPIAWQGWALTFGYVAFLAGMGLLAALPGTTRQVIAFALFLLGTAAFVEISRRRTRGGWKWRWGKPD